MTADATLHLAVVAASHNEVLTAMYADLGEVLRDFLRDDVGAELTPESHMDHARLVEAIRAGDGGDGGRGGGQPRVPLPPGAAGRPGAGDRPALRVRSRG